MSAHGGQTTPTIMDYNSLEGASTGAPNEDLQDLFASPRVLVKQSQPLLSKNSFISYLNESTQDMALNSPTNR